MRVVLRPTRVIRRAELPNAAGAGPDPLRFPALDEDEATMAVAGVRALLEETRVDPGSVRQVRIAAPDAAVWAPVLAAATGLPADRIDVVTPGELERLAAEPGAQGGQPQGPSLHVLATRGRAGSRELESGEVESMVVVRLVGGPADRRGDAMVRIPTIQVSPAAYAKIVEWERRAPLEVPRGAYVPAGTWSRTGPARYRLLAGRCANGHRAFPPRAQCASCGQAMTEEPLPPTGTVRTYTVIAKGGGPSEFDAIQDTEGEYGVVIADLGGVAVPGMLCDTPPSRLRVGLRVEAVFRRLFAQEGVWRYGTKFRAVEAEEKPRGPTPR